MWQFSLFIIVRCIRRVRVHLRVLNKVYDDQERARVLVWLGRA